MNPAATALTIEELTGPEEVEEFQALERAIWEGTDLEVVPGHVLLTHRRYGGMLLVARDPERRGVGILLGFPGLKGGTTVHCSHLLGVLPDWRSRDVGYAMKRRQRELVLDQGLDLVLWTYDPLETRNARLNIGRLGAIAHQYTPNLYGIMRDGLNAGLETDRLTVEWHIRHPLVAGRLARAHIPPPAPLLAAGTALPIQVGMSTYPGFERPFPVVRDLHLGLDAHQMLVEAPAEFQALKRADPEAARTWRTALRAVLQDIFARGYAAVDLLTEHTPGGGRRCYYLIEPAELYLGQG